MKGADYLLSGTLHMEETRKVTGDEALFVSAMRVLTEPGHTSSERDSALVTLDRLSAEGHVRATVLLGICYDEGFYVEKSLEMAKTYFERATFLGSANGEYRLGVLMLQDNKYRDLVKGVQHVKNAAGRGLKDALNTLGDMYVKGIGVEKNLNEAERYYQFAADRGLGLAWFHLYELANARGDHERADSCLKAAKDHGYDVATGKQDYLREEYLQ